MDTPVVVSLDTMVTTVKTTSMTVPAVFCVRMEGLVWYGEHYSIKQWVEHKLNYVFYINFIGWC